MEEGADLGPVPIAWWRFLGIGVMIGALYLGVRAVAASPQTHAALLGPAIVLGGAIGLLVGRREAAVLRSPQQSCHRGRRSRRAVSKSAARSYVAGLAGIGLILAQALSSSAMEWLMLGGVALSVGAAGHAWVMARNYERTGTNLTN